MKMHFGWKAHQVNGFVQDFLIIILFNSVGKLFAQYTKYVSLFLDLLITSSRPKTTEHLNSHTKKNVTGTFHEVSHLHIT